MTLVKPVWSVQQLAEQVYVKFHLRMIQPVRKMKPIKIRVLPARSVNHPYAKLILEEPVYMTALVKPVWSVLLLAEQVYVKFHLRMIQPVRKMKPIKIRVLPARSVNHPYAKLILEEPVYMTALVKPVWSVLLLVDQHHVKLQMRMIQLVWRMEAIKIRVFPARSVNLHFAKLIMEESV